jgi:hypothetical protein
MRCRFPTSDLPAGAWREWKACVRRPYRIRTHPRGLSEQRGLMSYTWAKSLDTASDESQTSLSRPVARQSPSLDRGPWSVQLALKLQF